MIEEDVARFEHLGRQLLLKLDADADQDRDFNDPRIDAVLVVAIVAYTDDDGEERETSSIYSETTRPHVRRGILEAALDPLR